MIKKYISFNNINKSLTANNVNRILQNAIFNKCIVDITNIKYIHLLCRTDRFHETLTNSIPISSDIDEMQEKQTID